MHKINRMGVDLGKNTIDERVRDRRRRRALYLSIPCRIPMMLAIRLPSEIEERLDRLAKATGRTKTFYAREAILEYLDELEDLYLAEQRFIDNQSGRSRTYTLEEVERELGLQD